MNLRALHPKMEKLVDEKLSRTLLPVGTRAGSITAAAARLTGLKEGTAVAVANVDAHVSIPAVGITSPGKMLAIIGTSTCHMLLGDTEHEVPGMCEWMKTELLRVFSVTKPDKAVWEIISIGLWRTALLWNTRQRPMPTVLIFIHCSPRRQRA
jgi:ribulose kinase